MTNSDENHDFTEDEKKLFEDLIPEDLEEILDKGLSRRHFLKLMGIASGGLMASQLLGAEQVLARPLAAVEASELASTTVQNPVEVSFRVNGEKVRLILDSRMTLLDTLREKLQLTGSKKGCDHGQCGACTVLDNDTRILSCLTLAASCQNRSITTIEGVAKGNKLHPVQEAFLYNDGFQCGYCTPGQICSAIALMAEAKRGDLSYLSKQITSQSPVQLNDEDIRERMSGNICRCGAYPNIVAAIKEVQNGPSGIDNWTFVKA